MELDSSVTSGSDDVLLADYETICTSEVKQPVYRSPEAGKDRYQVCHEREARRFLFLSLFLLSSFFSPTFAKKKNLFRAGRFAHGQYSCQADGTTERLYQCQPRARGSVALCVHAGATDGDDQRLLAHGPSARLARHCHAHQSGGKGPNPLPQILGQKRRAAPLRRPHGHHGQIRHDGRHHSSQISCGRVIRSARTTRHPDSLYRMVRGHSIRDAWAQNSHSLLRV